MELKWLEDFISLTNTHSFRRSAEQRNISQPAFSRRIHALESWLGTSLIDRSTYPTTLTENGKAFREVAEQALILFQKARDDVRGHGRRTRATISFSALHSVALGFFPKWMTAWRAFLGPLVTQINPGNFHDCVQALVDGNSDILLCYSHEAVPVLLDPQIYPSIKLAEDCFMPVSGTDRRQRALFRYDGRKAKEIPWLTYTSESYLWRVEEYILSRQKPPLPLSAVCENPMGESLKAMALEGHGVAWVTKSSIADELADKRLVPFGPRCLQLTFDIRMYRAIQNARPELLQFWSCAESLSSFTDRLQK